MENTNKEEFVTQEELFNIENDERLNSIVSSLEKTLGNTKEHQKLTKFFFQGRVVYKEASVDEMIKNDGVYLRIVLFNPQNTSQIAAVLPPIKFKDDIFKLKQEDFNALCNTIDKLFFEALTKIKEFQGEQLEIKKKATEETPKTNE